ncbi:hypothetical protein HAQ01_04920 [Acidithiobacillus thiooxidans]|uniref:hypothetical protein n=1 Tax=Acidithiobacillus thiooxidans TaxID=930 RepID=UPI001C07C3D4|nr:hypothetical protein [Acidithiobacillus thiooxidans]MBU2792744.1 hypothetical protein [Acidithiobacillus thiooxidans]
MRVVVFRDCVNGRSFRREMDLSFLPHKGLMIQPREYGVCVTVDQVKYVCEKDTLLVFTEGRATDSEVACMLSEGGWIRQDG